jgi:hypothetical protein
LPVTRIRPKSSPREPVAFPRPDLRDGDIVKLLVAERRPVVADRALQREERLRAGELSLGQRLVVAGEELVPRRVVEGELVDHESGDRVRRVRERHVLELGPGIRRLEQTAVLADRTEALHQSGPDVGEIVVRDRGQLVAGKRAHLESIRDREHRLRRQRAELEHLRHLGGDLRSGGCVETALRVDLHASVPEQMLQRVQVERRRRVPRDESCRRRLARRPETSAALPDGQALVVPRREGREMARHARDVAIAAENLVEREGLAELRQGGAHVRCGRKRNDSSFRRQLPHERRRDHVWGRNIVARGTGRRRRRFHHPVGAGGDAERGRHKQRSTAPL